MAMYNNGSTITTYNSFIAMKNDKFEENTPEILLSSYLEIDLMEKVKNELEQYFHENLIVLAFRNIPLCTVTSKLRNPL